MTDERPDLDPRDPFGGRYSLDVHLVNGNAWELRRTIREFLPDGVEKDWSLRLLGFPGPWNERMRERNANLSDGEQSWAIVPEPNGPACGFSHDRVESP